jgi:thymidylate kinase
MGDQTLSNTMKCGDRFIHSSKHSSEPSRSREDFLLTLFSTLDSNQVRYCVLHSWEELPQNLSSDLDIAVHPQDHRKLALVFQPLKKRGYSLVQVINYFVKAYCFRFLWFEGPTINSLAVDVIFKHQRGALIAPSVKVLVSGRRRHGIFWIPPTEAEFTYLLARKTWKGTAPVRQQRRLKLLVEQLGRPTAEKLAGELFLGTLKLRVVEACASGRLNPLLAQIKAQAWGTSLVRNPLRLIANLLSDGMRLVRRWLQPTGLLVAVMGPDGAGKSTLIEHLVQVVGPAFDRHRLFHWRPMLLRRRKSTRDTTRPHSLPPHGRWWSVARLFAHLLDYWLGYWLVIRPLLARSGLVVFDRYFDDVLIDPKRYRYGGPLWWARILRPVIPKPDLVLILDASAEVLLSRKHEVAFEEIQRQRRLYARCINGAAGTRVISASGSVSHVSAEAATDVIEQLSQRVERQHGRWMASDRPRDTQRNLR